MKLQGFILAKEFVSNTVAQAFTALFKTTKIPNDRFDIVDVSTSNMTILLYTRSIQTSKKNAN